MAAWLALLALLAVACSMAAQPVTARADDRAGRYIVSTYTQTGTDGAVSRLGRTRPSQRYTGAVNGFAATLTAGQLASLRRDPRVRTITADRVLRISSAQSSPTWGLDRIDQRSDKPDRSYSYGTTGAGVTVFSIDTGVRLDHQDFGGRATSGYDFVDHDTNAADCNGHGTHVGATAVGSTYGVAKGAKLVALRVLNCAGDGLESNFIAALQYVIDHRPTGPAVVNISAGGDESPTLNRAVGAVVAAGIPVVVAAGNEEANACHSSPASAPTAITVGAATKSDGPAYFTNYGSCLDVFAPGTDVISAAVSSPTATATMDGTSMATPHVTGAAARYLQANPKATPAAVSRALVGDATSAAFSDGRGSPNKLLYLRSGATGSPLGTASKRSDSARTITTSWGAPYGFGAAAVTSYRVTRSGAADATGATTATAVLAATARSYRFSNLRHGVSYTVKVVAVNAAGAGSASSTKVSMLAGPGKARVAKPAAGSTKDSSTSITAKWKSPTSGGKVSTYAIAVRRVGSGSVKTYSGKSSARSLKASKLKRNASYVVRVRALNAAGKGSWSAWSAKAKAR